MNQRAFFSRLRVAMSVFVMLLLPSTLLAQSGAPTPAIPAALQLVASGVIDPVSVRQPPDGTERLFIVEKIGRIRIIDHGILLAEPFLDLTTTTISASPEQGMYDIAFHPNFVSNGLVYISHTERYLDGALVVWEYHVDPAYPNLASLSQRRPIIAVQRRAMFHNGGSIAFGPDGYLYIGVGEGRPYQYTWAPVTNYAQNLENLDGKLLRIDVDSPLTDAGTAAFSYLVPANPFGGPTSRVYAYRADMDMMRGDIFPEIWAYGLRNPWRFAFDPLTGDLFIPDVGEAYMEEVNFQPATSVGGENYGWAIAEGSSCQGTQCKTFTPPVYAYHHDDGRCAIIGLGVLRTADMPEYAGNFFFADYCSGEVSALRKTGSGWRVSSLFSIAGWAPDRQIAGGGSDHDGNVYVTTCSCASSYDQIPATDARRQTGAVWRIVGERKPAPTAPVASPAALITSPDRGFRTTIQTRRRFAVA